MFNIDSWHGSGADFLRFDHSHMGEGEGTQVYWRQGLEDAG